MSKSKEDLVNVLTQVKKSSAEAGLYLNLKKTKVMATEQINEFKLGDENIEIVNNLFFGIKNGG